MPHPDSTTPLPADGSGEETLLEKVVATPPFDESPVVHLMDDGSCAAFERGLVRIVEEEHRRSSRQDGRPSQS